MKKKAVVLLSGGLDSTTCLAHAVADGYDCYALSFDYNQRHTAELHAAKKIAAHYAVRTHEIVSLAALSFLSESNCALINPQINVPVHHSQNNPRIPVTYVPARNTVFLSIALSWAEILDATTIIIGVSAVDYSGYPDCRPEYMAAFQQMAHLATKAAIEGSPVDIITPLIALSKAQTIQLGMRLGVDYQQTVSCYQATDDGLACGACDSCHWRQKGFLEAGFKDPTRYIEHYLL